MTENELDYVFSKISELEQDIKQIRDDLLSIATQMSDIDIESKEETYEMEEFDLKLHFKCPCCYKEDNNYCYGVPPEKPIKTICRHCRKTLTLS